MLNVTTLNGRLTATPELKTVQSGKSVTSFTVAVEHNYAKGGGERKTDFIRCVAWGTTAEFLCKHFNKGDMVGIVGTLQTRKFTAKDGTNREVSEVVIQQLSFVGNKSSSAHTGADTFVPAQIIDDDDILDEDLPF